MINKHLQYRMNNKEFIKRYLLLTISLVFISMGIVLTRHSELGVTTISSVPNVISLKYNFFTLGTWLNIWNTTLVIAQIIILRKDFKAQELLQFLIAFLNGIFTDLFMLFITHIPMINYSARLITAIFGVVILATGVSLSFIANVLLSPAEAFVRVVASKFNKNIGDVKISFDIFCVITAIILSLIFFDFKLVGVREGTLIAAIMTGPIVKVLNRLIKVPIDHVLSK